MRRLRWTVKDYFKLAEVGVLDDRRVELLDGDLVECPSQTLSHCAAISRTSRALLSEFAADQNWVVIRGTLRLSRFNAPDPDFHVLGVPIGTPAARLPPPLLVIEVSDNTYTKDADVTLRVYARAGVADYWIVNLPARRVEVYRRPENPTPSRRSGWRYAEVTSYQPGSVVRPLLRPEVAIPVDAMLP